MQSAERRVQNAELKRNGRGRSFCNLRSALCTLHSALCTRAFTLIELMVVILILAFAASVVYPRLSGGLIERERLRASVNQLAAVAAHGRDQSAATQQPLILTLDMDLSAYRLAGASQDDTDAGGGAGLHGALAEGVTFRSVRLTGRPEQPGKIVQLRFTPEGWADPAIIQLAGSDGDVNSIVITAPAGRVETYPSAVSGDE
jgi:prepilin-type N-terminal cleavage/methylation domain-containing protein